MGRMEKRFICVGEKTKRLETFLNIDKRGGSKQWVGWKISSKLICGYTLLFETYEYCGGYESLTINFLYDMDQMGTLTCLDHSGKH